MFLNDVCKENQALAGDKSGRPVSSRPDHASEKAIVNSSIPKQCERTTPSDSSTLAPCEKNTVGMKLKSTGGDTKKPSRGPVNFFERYNQHYIVLVIVLWLLEVTHTCLCVCACACARTWHVK